MADRLVVVGGGLVGSLLALHLAQAGHKVDVYERRPDLRGAGGPEGRSINLACSDRGWRALESVGVADRCREIAIPMRGRMMHALDGELSFQPYGTGDQAIYSISRGELNNTLLTAAEEHPNVTLHFDQKCVDVDLDTGEITFEHTETGEPVHVAASVVFGADGAHSAIRSKMARQDRFDFSQEFIAHGYKELTIPAAEDGAFVLDEHALHIWPRGQYMLIALANLDGSFTCTLFLPHDGDPSFETLTSPEAVQAFFAAEFPDALDLMPGLADNWQGNPTSSLGIIRCFPWTHEGKVALVGDAAHAIVPFYGQGMNAGFEDCTALMAALDRHGNDFEAAFKDYEVERKPNADAIADLAMTNFVEMRDLVGNPQFLLRKRIGAELHNRWPYHFVPIYSLVTFSDVPYAEARDRGMLQDELLDTLLATPGIEALLDQGSAGDVLDAALQTWLTDDPEPTPDEGSKAVTYASYLKVEELLSLQHLKSDPPEHDELLFIVIHQVYELWFKILLHELDQLKVDLSRGALHESLARLKRARTVLKTLVAQIDILETMTPLSFASFRSRLESASGFQSAQFREVEFVLGYKRPEMIDLHPANQAGHVRLQRRLREPSVVDAFYDFLETRGVDIPAELRAKAPEAPNVASSAIQDSLVTMYERQPDVVLLLELMTDFDEGLQEWRYRHVKMVERTLGHKVGTGGSSGAEFLRRSLFNPVFPDLWEVRSRF